MSVCFLTHSICIFPFKNVIKGMFYVLKSLTGSVRCFSAALDNRLVCLHHFLHSTAETLALCFVMCVNYLSICSLFQQICLVMLLVSSQSPAENDSYISCVAYNTFALRQWHPQSICGRRILNAVLSLMELPVLCCFEEAAAGRMCAGLVGNGGEGSRYTHWSIPG